MPYVRSKLTSLSLHCFALACLPFCPAQADCPTAFQALTDLQQRSYQGQQNFTYFLHIPRTAGRTLWSCFLKPGLPVAERCAKSYDVLRFEPGITSCGLLSSHDDYSMLHTLLPANTTSVTQLRDPLQRVLSAYEFSVEVAARFEGAPDNSTFQHNRTLTTEVWPWSLLVPMVQEDIANRVSCSTTLVLKALRRSNVAHAACFILPGKLGRHRH